jgi:hypothetical protein
VSPDRGRLGDGRLVRKLGVMFHDLTVNVGRAQLLSSSMTRFCSRRWQVNRAWSEIRCGSSKSIRTGRPSFTRSRTSSHALSTTLPGVIWVGRMELFRSLMGSICSVLLSQLTGGVR